MTATATRSLNDEMRHCIDACINCHAVCEATLSYGLARHGSYTDRNDVLVLLDCADICRTSAAFLLRGSNLHPYPCQACATICAACADWCEERPRDPVMRQCAATCRECADSCLEMVRP